MRAINPVIRGPKTRPGLKTGSFLKYRLLSIHMWNNRLYTGYAKRNICYIELCVIISVVYLDVNLITIL